MDTKGIKAEIMQKLKECVMDAHLVNSKKVYDENWRIIKSTGESTFTFNDISLDVKYDYKNNRAFLIIDDLAIVKAQDDLSGVAYRDRDNKPMCLIETKGGQAILVYVTTLYDELTEIVFDYIENTKAKELAG